MISPETFFRKFQINYFDLKAFRLKRELEEIENKKNPKFSKILNYDVRDHERSIRIDIRQNYFYAIETLFELILTLEPPQGLIDERYMLYRLSEPRHQHRRIKDFAQEKGGLSFLDDYTDLTDGRKISILQYIFYSVIDNPKIEKSLEMIKMGLQLLANDILDKREFNAYKHGLRIFPALDIFELGIKNKDHKFKFDMSDSMTLFEFRKKENEMEYLTITFDTERDFNMTGMASNFISNIINSRRIKFYEDEVNIFFWDEELLKLAESKKIGSNRLSFVGKIKPKK